MTDSISIYTPEAWHEYELIDSGEGGKLERFGGYIMARPDPRAIWKKTAPGPVWENAHAVYRRTSDTSGDWVIRKNPPKPWQISYRNLTFVLKPAAFKHVGVFPEQAPNWEWIDRAINGKPAHILNLFAYTGGATMAALSAGAHVTHVDASKPSVSWAKENADVSGLSEKPVRWILDDAYKFVVREARRGNTYDGIIMDPPRFGRGARGEVWKLEQDLPKLLHACRDIISPEPVLFLLNAYTVDLSSIALSRVLHDLMPQGTFESGELAIQDTTSGKLLPCGVFSRWSR